MKTLIIFSIVALLMAISSLSFAQTKTETFNVSGNCGMCKTKIEKAAKDAGASAASWDVDAKQLTVTYKSSTTNAAKIQQKVAEVGYDNAGFKATAEAYNKLHGCCKYERETAAASETHSCSGKCDMKDGKCADMTDGKKMDCAKDGKCTKHVHEGQTGEKMDCCKDGKCSMPGHDGKDCCKKDDAKMDCCKDGKCSMPGHDGKDCCKKS